MSHTGASAKADRAATPSEPSQSTVVSGIAGIPCASDVADKLAEARALIKRGWTQKTYREGDCVCALGAILTAYGHNWKREPSVSKISRLPAASRLKRAIGVSGYLGAYQNSVVAWNDSPLRKKTEVLAAFDKAIELAREGQPA